MDTMEDVKMMLRDQEKELNSGNTDKYEQYVDLDRRMTQLNNKLKELRGQRDNLKEVIIDEMRGEGVKTKSFEDGPQFTVVEKDYYSCLKAERGSLVDWALENDLKDSLNIHSQSLNSIMKEMDEEEEELPEFINKFTKHNLSVRGK